MAKVGEIKIGFEIAEKAFGTDYQFGGAEHDIIYLLPPDVTLDEEDERALKVAGWHYSDHDGWYHNV